MSLAAIKPVNPNPSASTPVQPMDVSGHAIIEKNNQTPNLFPDQLSATDTKQGPIGDCTYISAIDSLAANNPDLLRNDIKNIGTDAQGTDVYEVKLFEDGEWKNYDVSADTGEGALGQNNSAYGPIYEKALALANGGYNVLNQGANQVSALRQLTGQDISEEYGPDAAHAALDAVASGGAAVAGTCGIADGYYDPETGAYNGPEQIGSHDIDIDGSHAYAVVGVSGSGSTAIVTLENPWDSGGNDGLNGPGDGSYGTFQVSVQAFENIFKQYGYTKGADNRPPLDKGTSYDQSMESELLASSTQSGLPTGPWTVG